MEEQVRNLARDFTEQELRKRWEELDCRNSALLTDILKRAANIGVFSFLLSQEIGGAGFSPKDYCIFLEEIAKGCPGIGLIFATHLMGITPILLSKDAGKKIKFLSAIVESEKQNSPLIFTAAINEEKFSGLIPGNIQTAVKSYRLSGSKINVCSGEIANCFSLLARLEGSDKFGWFIIPSNLKGTEIKGEKYRMGLKICPMNNIHFKDVEILPENILDETELSDLVDYYRFFDSPLGAVGLGMAEEAYDIALKYTTERYQGGKIICEHEAVKVILSEMKLSIETAKIFVYNSSHIVASAYASEMAEKVCINAIQLLGGYGYMEDFRVERILRDAKTYQGIVNPVSRKMEYIGREIERLR